MARPGVTTNGSRPGPVGDQVWLSITISIPVLRNSSVCIEEPKEASGERWLSSPERSSTPCHFSSPLALAHNRKKYPFLSAEEMLTSLHLRSISGFTVPSFL